MRLPVSRMHERESSGGTVCFLSAGVAACRFDAAVVVGVWVCWVSFGLVCANAGRPSAMPPHAANSAMAKSRLFMTGLLGGIGNFIVRLSQAVGHWRPTRRQRSFILLTSVPPEDSHPCVKYGCSSIWPRRQIGRASCRERV